ncbi:TerC family protein [Pleomorphomonas sp. NRK KF1]|uniref:TerC family protein n=1 Tax=Pleomorphomonas sp. NRK KF1 TaxID=2943000 RepID=UPI0020438D55|nr:TerC family protein [Pleomorphomonas sp. NRK KF1]MCM5554186.1 TerC family protein [Pleomorphomonas sp. NRK KF1]
MDLALLATPWLGTPLYLWLAFLSLVAFLLAFDLGVLHRKSEEISIRQSLILSGGYIAIGLMFGGFVWWHIGAESGLAYLTGFVIEKTLALDNIFVIALIFSFFGIPRRYQHRALFWGILGVIVLRGIMIGAGATLVAEFHWILYLFAAFLVLTGIKMLVTEDKEPDLDKNPLVGFLRRHLNVTKELDGDRFFVRRPLADSGRMALHATPLFLALVLIEAADIVFAVDSVPAIFAITTDAFVIYTSNIFAILGLRALYFALAAMIHRFRYLKPALALVLVFIGSKVFVAELMGLDKFPAAISLGVTFALVAGGVLVSLIKTRQETKVLSDNG